MEKTFFTSALMLMVAISLLTAVPAFGETSLRRPAGEEAGGAPKKVVAFYFHGKKRCGSCRTIEAYSFETISDGFSEELDSGRLEWWVINVQEPQNRHFIKDFKLTSWSLILVDVRNGELYRWKNLNRVWELLRNKQRFTEYVRQEVEKFLKGAE